MKVLLVTDGFFHPPFLGRLVLAATLRQMQGVSFDQINSLEKLPSNLEIYSALVLHFHHKSISSGALSKLDNFVLSGGGILAIHAATASFKKSFSYFNILGGRFIDHGKIDTIEAINLGSYIFSDLPNFVVRDELYIHELNEKIMVHYSAKLDTKEIPVVWTFLYGKGKVCYALPGHTTGSMLNQTYKKVLRRALEWVCKI
jgi:type 1 glutamine amidotransferase